MKERNTDELIEEITLHIMTASHERLQQMTRYSIAECFNINECRLSTVFHEVTNMKLSDYMERERMIRARAMLMNEQFSSTDELSLNMGIAKKNLFKRKFRKTFGASLEKYMERLRAHTSD